MAGFFDAAVPQLGTAYGTSTSTLTSNGTTSGTDTLAVNQTAPPVFGSGVQALLGSSTLSSIQNASSLASAPADLTGLSQVSPTAVQDFGQAQADTINAQGQQLIAQGDQAEAGAYGNAAAAARANVALAGASGALQVSQQQRAAAEALGGQQADIAAAGFGDSGTSVFLARDSASQAAQGTQVIQTNTAIQEGGYTQQALAADAEAAAANVAGTAATAAGNADTALASSATTAGNLAQALSLNQAASAKAGTTAAGTAAGASGPGWQGFGGATLVGGRVIGPIGSYVQIGNSKVQADAQTYNIGVDTTGTGGSGADPFVSSLLALQNKA